MQEGGHQAPLPRQTQPCTVLSQLPATDQGLRKLPRPCAGETALLSRSPPLSHLVLSLLPSKNKKSTAELWPPASWTGRWRAQRGRASHPRSHSCTERLSEAPGKPQLPPERYGAPQLTALSTDPPESAPVRLPFLLWAPPRTQGKEGGRREGCALRSVARRPGCGRKQGLCLSPSLRSRPQPLQLCGAVRVRRLLPLQRLPSL